ncbi:MAG: hypothetical protein F6K31_20680 [Symploca sp. SIO2G7]|nr:hypothetical protein [Symploca sp. SIO2G7]
MEQASSLFYPSSKSICTDPHYVRWWKVYTLTEVVGKEQQQQEKTPLLFDFELMVQTVEREQEKRDREKKEEKERLGVLEGLRKYAGEHVLLRSCTPVEN